MTKQTGRLYCKDRMVNVDLQKGFHRCIEDNQCFSDEPCPLNGMFDKLPDESQTETTSQPVPTE